MKTFIACLFIGLFTMSFDAPQKLTWNYPDFMIFYNYKTLPGRPCYEGYSNGKFVSGVNESFLVGVDSVAIKYIAKNQYQCYHDYYTNFYSRINQTQWKKYGADGKFIKVITEYRADTSVVENHNDGTTVYYKVR